MSDDSTSIKDRILQMGAQARTAALALNTLSSDQKNRILLAMADALVGAEDEILEANAKDIAAAEENGLTSAMIDRLRLNPERIEAMAQGVREVAELNDPVGEVLRDWTPKNGIRHIKKRVPIGVIGIIYESRPNVTADAAVLCFKTGNATILRGGKEAIHSNRAIAKALAVGGESEGLPPHSIQLIPFTDRESVQHMAEMDDYLDLIIPRGGAGLIEAVVGFARMPVIKHYDGICHVFVDEKADLELAVKIAVNSKVQKPSVCNALETLLIHQDVAEEFAPRLEVAMAEKNVELRGDETFCNLVAEAIPATEADWVTEYLDYVLSVKVVASREEAIDHINRYGSKHTDCIVTTDQSAADEFLLRVDSACVFWNASTRFSDGGEFGFGAEIGISTDKLHARGPMGLEELTSYKYLLIGDGQLK